MKGVGEEGGEMNGGLTGREKVRRVDLKGAFFIEACHGGRCQDPASTISASRGVDIIKEADERYALQRTVNSFGSTLSFLSPVPRSLPAIIKGARHASLRHFNVQGGAGIW